jgi:DNA-binding transcriptional MerR regulator
MEVSMLIAQVAEAVGVHPETIRRLERAGVVRSERDKNGWRIFDQSAVEELRRLYRRVPSENESVQT